MKAAIIGSRSLTVDDLGKYKKTALFLKCPQKVRQKYKREFIQSD